MARVRSSLELVAVINLVINKHILKLIETELRPSGVRIEYFLREWLVRERGLARPLPL